MKSQYFLDVNDVASYTGTSVSMAYKIIRTLNKELSNQGYLTIAGKVSRVYFEKKFYGDISPQRG